MTKMKKFSPIAFAISITPIAAANFAVAAGPKVLDTLQLDGRSLKRDSLKSTLLTAEDIERTGASNLGEVLKQQPGLDFRVNASGLTDVSIRGSRAQHVLVLIDGVRVNDPSDPARAFDFSRLNPDTIEKIEVIKGAGSVAYGADALAGTILITTKRKRGVTANLEGGSYSTLRSALSARGAISPNITPSFNLGYETLTGPSQAVSPGGDEDSKTNLQFKAGADYEDDSRTFLLGLSGSHNQVNQDLDSGSYSDNTGYTSESTQNTGEIRLKKNWNDTHTSHSQFSHLTTKRNYDNLNANTAFSEPSREEYQGTTTQGELEHRLSLPLAQRNLEILLGAEGVWEELEVDSTNATDSFYPVKQHQLAAFAQSKIPLLTQSDLTFGLRETVNEINENALTYRGSFSHEFHKNLHFDFSVGSGFKTPSLYQIYSPTYGNSSLRNERSTSYSTSLKSTFYEVALFRTEFTDLIAGDPANDYRSVNINSATTQGGEVSLNLPLNLQWTLSPHYTFLDTKDHSTGLEIPGRAKHKGGFTLRYAPDDRTSFQSEFYVKSARFEGASFSESPGYGIVNLSGQYRITQDPSVNFHVRVENALNQFYMEKRGYSSPGFGIYGGLRLQL
jgi:vitamin B12 transporter